MKQSNMSRTTGRACHLRTATTQGSMGGMDDSQLVHTADPSIKYMASHHARRAALHRVPEACGKRQSHIHSTMHTECPHCVRAGMPCIRIEMSAIATEQTRTETVDATYVTNNKINNPSPGVRCATVLLIHAHVMHRFTTYPLHSTGLIATAPNRRPVEARCSL